MVGMQPELLAQLILAVSHAVAITHCPRAVSVF
jgi:hypothetical protein